MHVIGRGGGGTGLEHSILVRTEGDSRAAIAMGTRVWARTSVTSGPSPNGRVLQGGRVHAATGAGDIN
jgi:hypothetical protein